MKRAICVLSVFFPCWLTAQVSEKLPAMDTETYYAGINPIAPFTLIRGEATSLYLPYIGGQEAGVALFIGKIWNRNYNVETRLSYGTPRSSYTLFQVQSGFNYCFDSHKSSWNPYAGVFIKLYKLHEQEADIDKASAIGYIDIGNRFVFRPLKHGQGIQFFIDTRVNQNIAALKWTNEPGTKARAGFYNSIYKWPSPYIPYATVNIGFFFK